MQTVDKQCKQAQAPLKSQRPNPIHVWSYSTFQKHETKALIFESRRQDLLCDSLTLSHGPVVDARHTHFVSHLADTISKARTFSPDQTSFDRHISQENTWTFSR